MHIIFLNQYFPPDVAPTGFMLEGVAAQLAEQNHEVTILCARGGYGEAGNEKIFRKEPKKYRVIRIGTTWFGRKTLLGKLVDYAVFYIGTARYLIFSAPKSCRLIALTTPPLLSILVRLLSKVRGGDHAHWVMDLYPDVMVAHGLIQESGLAHRILGFLTRWGFGGERCKGVWSLGPDMKRSVDSYLNEGTKSEWIALWGNEGQLEEISVEAKVIRKMRGWEDGDLVVMYSGNLGLGHLFNEILEVAGTLAPNTDGKNFRFSFHGQGKRRIEIEKFQKTQPGASVELHGYESEDRLRAHLRSADLHLVSLNPEWDGAMVPSKLQGIFAIGRPVVFVGSEDCAIGQWIKESGGGWVVAPRDVDGLWQVLLEAEDGAELANRGEAAIEFSKKVFSKRINTRRYAHGFSQQD